MTHCRGFFFLSNLRQVQKQTQLIAKYAASGHRTKEAEKFLCALNATLGALERHRDIIVNQLRDERGQSAPTHSHRHVEQSSGEQ